MTPRILLVMLALVLVPWSASAEDVVSLDALAAPADAVAADVGVTSLAGTSAGSLEGLVPTAVPALPAVPGADSLGVTLGEVQDTVDRLLACQTVVQITLTAWGGDILDERDGQMDFITTESIEIPVATERIPIYDTVTETVGGTVGTVLGIVEPATRTVERLVGYEVITYSEQAELDVAVYLDWDEEYIDWTKETHTFYVTLPVGLPFVAAGDGVVMMVCDDRPIFDYEPAPDMSGYDYVSILPMDDGWYRRVLSLQVSIATPQEIENLPREEAIGYSFCPGDLLERAREQAATRAAGGTMEDVMAQADARIAGGQAPGFSEQGRSEEATEPEVVSTGGVEVASSSAGLLGAVAAAALGLVAMPLWRKLR